MPGASDKVVQVFKRELFAVQAVAVFALAPSHACLRQLNALLKLLANKKSPRSRAFSDQRDY
jgi:hypothetical protein